MIDRIEKEQNQFLPPVDVSELDQPSRWENEIKIFSYLYRKLNVDMPNLVSMINLITLKVRDFVIPEKYLTNNPLLL